MRPPEKFEKFEEFEEYLQTKVETASRLEALRLGRGAADTLEAYERKPDVMGEGGYGKGWRIGQLALVRDTMSASGARLRIVGGMLTPGVGYQMFVTGPVGGRDDLADTLRAEYFCQLSGNVASDILPLGTDDHLLPADATQLPQTGPYRWGSASELSRQGSQMLAALALRVEYSEQPQVVDLTEMHLREDEVVTWFAGSRLARAA